MRSFHIPDVTKCERNHSSLPLLLCRVNHTIQKWVNNVKTSLWKVIKSIRGRIYEMGIPVGFAEMVLVEAWLDVVVVERTRKIISSQQLRKVVSNIPRVDKCFRVTVNISSSSFFHRSKLRKENLSSEFMIAALTSLIFSLPSVWSRWHLQIWRVQQYQKHQTYIEIEMKCKHVTDTYLPHLCFRYQNLRVRTRTIKTST